MVVIILKAIFIYFIISFFRSLWRGYKMVEDIKKKGAHNFQGFEQQTHQDSGQYDYSDQKTPKSKRSKKSNTVIEAEFRVIDKE